MGGKALLLIISGFTLVFMVISQNFGNYSTRAVENMVEYHNEIITHNIAVSGANLAANQIYFDPDWNTGYQNIPFQNGILNVSVELIDAYEDLSEIKSVATYNGYTSEVRVQVAPTKYSKFAYFSVNEGGTIWWTGNDTVWGPFHTQDYLRAYRHPVFFGKATTKRDLIYYTSKSKDKPYFYGGFEKGVNLPLPSDGLNKMELAAQDEGLFMEGHDTIYVTFVLDTLKFRYSYNAKDSSLYLPTGAPNGVIYAKNSVLRLKGVVKGQYSIACSKITTGKGKIFIDDDIIYDKDPRVYLNSTDLLGIVAKSEIIITENDANNTDINIHAALYAETGGFGAENFDSRPLSGNINLLGGITQNIRRAVGQFDSDGTTSGFSKRYQYDDRLMLASPPYFPGTGNFEIVSWYE
jgi:hypothetical protein